MARSLHSDTIAEVQTDSVIPYFMALVETGNGDVAVWSGIGDIVSSVSGSSITYIGVGEFAMISPMKESQDLAARGINLSLSGIPSALLSILLGDVEQGRSVSVFMGFFNESTRTTINNEFELFNGIVDIPSVAESGDTATIAISAANRLIDLGKVRVRRYTQEDQARDDVTDLGFEFVPSLQDKEILFGSSR